MIAVIKTGGKQYKIKEGDILKIEKILDEVGKTVKLEVLLIADETGASMKLGTPNISGASVSAEVVEQGRSPKVAVIKFKPKVRYKRNVGHRQPFTKVKITAITA